MTTVTEQRWPFCFSLDDLEITGCVLPNEPPMVDGDGLPINRSWSGRSEAGPQRAGERVPGVWLTHTPTGKHAISTQMATRDENLQMALRRLDRQVRNAQ